MFKTKRAYAPASVDDGYRVLIDRLWPRGIKKSDLLLDEWTKELSPSGELRKSFGHDPAKWKEFRARYRMELRVPAARKKIEELSARGRNSTVTLVYGARDEEHNDAVVLKDLIERAAQKLSVGGRSPRKVA